MEYYHLGISRKGVRLILIIRQFTSPGQQDHLRDGNVRLKLNGTLWPERDQVVLPLSDEKLDYPLVYQDPKDKKFILTTLPRFLSQSLPRKKGKKYPYAELDDLCGHLVP